jgi:predicted MFS family arabinose efflux permease
MFAPLLGVIAAGVGMSLVTAGVLVAVFEGMGFVSPVAGWMVDRLGSRRMMVVSLGGFGAAAVLAAGSRGVPGFALAIVALGLTAMVYESASTAWVAATTPYDQRAAVLSRLDTAWAGGLLIGVPIVAGLSLWTWRASYAAVAALAFVALWHVSRRVGGPVLVASANAAMAIERRSWQWPTIRRGLWIIGPFGLLAAASQLVVVVYGVWLEERHRFPTAAVGAVGFVFGLGDLAATLTTMRVTDRIGKIRAVRIGVGALVVAALALSVVHRHPVGGVCALLVLLVCYEFALLSAKPLLTEIDPDNRGLGIGLGFGAAAGCRAVAAVIGTATFAAGGLGANALVAAATASVALVVVVAGSRRSRPSPS